MKSTALIEAFRADPSANVHELAAQIGMSSNFAYSVLRENGFVFRVRLSPDNADWLRREADRSGVSVNDMLNAILTDARNDDA